MSREMMQQIKNYIGQLHDLANLIRDKKLRKVNRDIAEERFIEIKRVIDMHSIEWLGELIKMVEDKQSDTIHNRSDIT